MAKAKVKKIKQKSHRGASKRFKVTGTGKVKARGRAYTSHLSTNKTTKQKRQLRKKIILKDQNRAIKKMLSKKA